MKERCADTEERDIYIATGEVVVATSTSIHLCIRSNSQLITLPPTSRPTSPRLPSHPKPRPIDAACLPACCPPIPRTSASRAGRERAEKHPGAQRSVASLCQHALRHSNGRGGATADSGIFLVYNVLVHVPIPATRLPAHLAMNERTKGRPRQTKRPRKYILENATSTLHLAAFWSSAHGLFSTSTSAS